MTSFIAMVTYWNLILPCVSVGFLLGITLSVLVGVTIIVFNFISSSFLTLDVIAITNTICALAVLTNSVYTMP